MHTKLWQRLQQQVRSGKLPHALLFTDSAPEHQAFVQAFAQGLLCEEPQAGRACKICKACQLLTAQTHPDYHLLSHSAKSATIGIEVVRDLIEKCEQTPQCADKKIIIIFDAQHLNISASNALLKTLEEPAGNAYFFLTSKVPAALAATVRSRCQIVRFSEPVVVDTPAWQADFYAECTGLMQGTQDPLLMAQKWQKQDLLVLLEAFELYLTTQIRAQSNITPLFTLLDKVYALRKIALQHHSINSLLQLEALLIAGQAIKNGS